MKDVSWLPRIGATSRIKTTIAITTKVMIDSAAASRLTPRRSSRSVTGVSR